MPLLLILLKYLTVCACLHYCRSFSLSLYHCQCFKPILYVGINLYRASLNRSLLMVVKVKSLQKNSFFVKSYEINSTM